VDDNVSKELRMLRCDERGAALAQAQHGDVHAWHGYEIRAPEFVDERGFEPRKQEHGHERRCGLAGKSLVGFALDHQIGILGREPCSGEAMHDVGSPVERDVRKDLVWLAGQHQAENVGLTHAKLGVAREPPTEMCRKFGIALERQDAATATGDSAGDDAHAGSEVEHQVARSNAGRVEQTIDEGAAAQEVLGMAEVAF
jgi:hypothetical protein